MAAQGRLRGCRIQIESNHLYKKGDAMQRKSKPSLTLTWLIGALGAIFFSNEMAIAVDYSSVNATVKQVQVWSGGSDQFGIRVLASAYPAGCGVFYVPHSAANKNVIYSAVLTAYTRGQPVSLQKGADANDLLVGGIALCLLNAITLQ